MGLEQKQEKFKAIKKELEAERDKFKIIVSSLSEGIDIIDKNYRICFQNQQLIDRFGDLKGKLCFETYMGRQVPCEFCLIRKAIRTGKTQKIELTAPGGKNYELTSTPFKDIDGKIKVIEIVRDITKLKETDREIKESKDRFRELFDHMSSGVAIYEAVKNGKDFIFKDFNRAAEKIENIKRENIIGKSVLNVFPGVKEFGLFDVFKRVWKTGTPEQHPIKLYKDDRISGWRENYVCKLPSGEIVAIYDDVTERKKREEEYKNLINGMNDTAFVIDFSGKFVDVNERAVEVLGYAREELLKMGPTDIDPNLSSEDIGLLIEGMKTDEKQVFPTQHKTKEGSVIPVEISSSRIIYNGEPHILSIARDISKRKEAEESLRKSEEKYRAFFENTGTAMLIVDESRIISLVNKKFEELAGFSKYEIEGKKSWMDFAAKGEIERMEQYHGSRVKGSLDAPKEYEFRFVGKDGKIKSVMVNVDTIPGTGKTIGSLLDVTERKKAMEALQESEERFQTVLENMPQGVLVHDLDGNIVLVNKTTCDHTGYTKEELLTMKVKDLDHESVSRNDRANLWLKLDKGGYYYFESTIYRKDGSAFPAALHISAINLEGDSMILVIANDITERKEALRKMQESEERFQVVLENIPHGVCLHNLDGEMLLVNKALCDMTGYSKEELLKMNVSDVDPASQSRDDRQKFWTQMKKGGSQRLESTHYRKDSSYYPAEIYLSAITINGRKMIVAIVHDITKRVEALEGLSKSEEKYRSLYESLPDAFVKTDLEGNILEFNKHYLDMFGYTGTEIKKLKSADLTPEKWFKYDAKIREEQILKRGYSDVYEKEYIKKDGTVFPVEIRSFLLNDEKGKPQSIWSIIRDISGRKKTEKELRKVERLESLGILAGGIAHDFNNLLTGILGNISLAQIKEGEDVGDLLEDAKQASIQAKNLTQQLLTFAKGGEPVKGEVSIENIIKIASDFALHGSNVKCVFESSPDLWRVEVDKGQMSQVIDNLVINAKQAMPSGGKIKIKTENIILKKGKTIPLPVGKYVKITFSDEGMGIPKNHLSKIFDPYFTTKQRGSGLGLATVFSVIQKHDGYVTVESEPGVGTTFHLYLPVKEKKKIEGATKGRVERYLRGEGRILVMDDEETIRNTLGGILKRLGYVVTLTTKGEEALKEYKKAISSGQPYDIVILDLTIAGGMGGKRTMEELLKIDPDVRAVVSSGYSTDPIMAHFDEYGFKAVVLKPYDVDELVKAIRKAFE